MGRPLCLVLLFFATQIFAAPHNTIQQHQNRHNRLGESLQGLLVNVYDNSAFVGKPISTTVVPSLEFTFPTTTFDFSAEITGQLETAKFSQNSLFFLCEFSWDSPSSNFRVLVASVWIDDHLVCHQGYYTPKTDNPLQPLSRTNLSVRIRISPYNFIPYPAPTIQQQNKTQSNQLFNFDLNENGTVSANIRWRRFGLPTKNKNTKSMQMSNFQQLQKVTIDETGRDMKLVGGEMSATVAECQARCEELSIHGCIGFVRNHGSDPESPDFCALRANLDPKQECSANLQNDPDYDVWIREDSCSGVETIDESLLTPELSAQEQSRDFLQKSLLQRKLWGNWVQQNVLDFVLLPSSMRFGVALCGISKNTTSKNEKSGNAKQHNGSAAHSLRNETRNEVRNRTTVQKMRNGDTLSCLRAVKTDDSPSTIRVGAHAVDFSYSQMYISFGSLNVSIEYSALNDSVLYMMITPVPQNTTNETILQIVPSIAYGMGGTFATNISENLSVLDFKPPGFDPVSVKCFSRNSVVPEGLDDGTFQFTLSNGDALACVSVASQNVPEFDDIALVIEEYKAKEFAYYQSFGELSEVKMAVQAGLMWNMIFTPTELGLVAPVGRSWNFPVPSISNDFDYILFEWDGLFASYMMALDSPPLAYSNLIQIIRAKSAFGFVPNYSVAGEKSRDRTEPPIGSQVVWKIYNKYRDVWLVELLFDDLLDWVNWFRDYRTLQPLNLICLGSDFVNDPSDNSIDAMQGARYESGLDNSPMYDGNFFDSTTGKMQLYDIGFSSLVAAELSSLAELAKLIGRPEASDLQNRANQLKKLISENLWDSEYKIFTNKFVNGQFYRRISPTSFYAMLAGAATDQQATEMVEYWLLNKSKFCISLNGDYENNDDSCYWGLPSISADDPAYPPLGYWRGYVWGPMAQLTYWSLENYSSRIPIIKQAKKALALQMKGMFLNMWNLNHHVCENFSPKKSATECTGDRLYHWGGLAGFLSFEEEGLF